MHQLFVNIAMCICIIKHILYINNLETDGNNINIVIQSDVIQFVLYILSSHYECANNYACTITISSPIWTLNEFLVYTSTNIDTAIKSGRMVIVLSHKSIQNSHNTHLQI